MRRGPACSSISHDVVLVGAVEHRRRDRHAVAAGCRRARRTCSSSRSAISLCVDLLAVDARAALLQVAAVGSRAAPSSISPICLPRPAAAQPRWVSRIWPTFMRRRHAERVEHDVDRRAVLEVRHVLDREDARDDALVAVAAGHLVARLQLALHRDEDLDHLHHARRQLVAALQLLDLVLEAVLQTLRSNSSNCFFSASISAIALSFLTRDLAPAGRA